MSAKIVNLKHEVCVQFPCDRCGHPIVAGLKDMGGMFRCRRCGTAVRMPTVPCYYEGCSGHYRLCNGTIQVLPAEDALRQAEQRAFESRWDEFRELRTTAAPTDDYRDAMGDLRAAVHAAAMANTIRYRCTRCGREYSWSYGQQHGPDRSLASCHVIKCSDCGRRPADELPEPERPVEAGR